MDIKRTAEIREVKVKALPVDERIVLMVEVKMMVLGCHVDELTSLCPEMGDRFYEGDMLAVGEVNPLTVQHSLDDITLTISRRKVRDCELKKGAKLHLLPEKLANVELTVSAEHSGDLALHIMKLLKTDCVVSLKQESI